ncbi:RNA polymerase sigma-70 factor [Sphingobacterium sp. NPDC055431]
MSHFDKYSDEKLLVLLKDSDPKAFTEIYKRYWDKLLVIASNKLSDILVAEEIVQDIFLDIWKRRQSIRLSDQIERYLAAALKYKIINYRHRLAVEQKFVDYSKRSEDEKFYSMENYLQFEELKTKLEKLVTQLPEKCQLVYKLSREEGLSQKEIAKRLLIAEKTVEAHLTRALKKIKSGLNYIICLFY